MGISGIGLGTNGGSAADDYLKSISSGRSSAAEEAKVSTSTRLAEQQKGGMAPKAAPTVGQSSNAGDITRIKAYANQHMSAAQIAQ